MKRIVTSLTLLTVMLLPAVAFAAPGATRLPPSGDVYAIAVALAMGIAAFGGATGQARAAAAALDGICRNPSAFDKVFTPMLLALAFVESLVIFVFVTAFIIG